MSSQRPGRKSPGASHCFLPRASDIGSGEIGEGGKSGTEVCLGIRRRHAVVYNVITCIHDKTVYIYIYIYMYIYIYIYY